MAPYGAWASPVRPEDLAERPAPFAPDPVEDGVYWLQLRPDEGGRTVLVWCARGGEPEDVTPEGFNVRTRVHEYGAANTGATARRSSSRTPPTDGSTGRTGGEGADAGHTVPGSPNSLRYADGRDHPRRLGRLRSRVPRGAGGPERPRRLPYRRLAAAASAPRGAGLLRLAAAEPRREAAVLADLEPPAAPLHGHPSSGRPTLSTAGSRTPSLSPAARTRRSSNRGGTRPGGCTGVPTARAGGTCTARART